MGHQSYVLLCTETALSNPPAVIPKSSCDVHLLRSPWLRQHKIYGFGFSLNFMNNFWSFCRFLNVPSFWSILICYSAIHFKIYLASAERMGPEIQLGKLIHELSIFNFYMSLTWNEILKIVTKLEYIFSILYTLWPGELWLHYIHH